MNIKEEVIGNESRREMGKEEKRTCQRVNC